MASEAGKLDITVDGVAKSVSLVDEQTGDMINTFQVYSRIYQMGWNEMTNAEKDNLAIKIAGKNQMEVFLAQMDNFQASQRALRLAINDGNSAWKENEKALDSVSGKMGRIKAIFQDIVTANGTLEAVAKAVLDIVLGLLKAIDTPLGKVVTSALALGTAFSGLNAILLKTTQIGLINWVKTLAENLIGLIKFLPQLVAGFTSSATAAGGLEAVLTLLSANPFFIGATIAVAVASFIALGDAMNGASEKAKEASESYNESVDAVKDLQTKIQNLESLGDKRTGSEQHLLELYRKQLKVLQEQERIKYKDDSKARDDLKNAYENPNFLTKAKAFFKGESSGKFDIAKEDVAYIDSSGKEQFGQNTKRAINLDLYKASIEEITDAYKLLSLQEGKTVEGQEEINDAIVANRERGYELIAELLERKDTLGYLTAEDEKRLELAEETYDLTEDDIRANEEQLDSLQSVADAYGVNADAIQEYIDKHPELADAIAEGGEAMTEAYEQAAQAVADQNSDLESTISNIGELENSYATLQNAVDNYNSTGTMTLEQIQQLAELSAKYGSVLVDNNGKLEVNEALMEKLRQTEINEAKAKLIQAAQERIKAIATASANEVTEEGISLARQATPALDAVGQAAVDNASKAAKGAIEWGKYYKAMANDVGVNFDKLTSGQKKAIDSVGAELKAQLNSLNTLASTSISVASKSSKAGQAASKAAKKAGNSAKKSAQDAAKVAEEAAKAAAKAWEDAFENAKDNIDSAYSTGIINAEQYAEQLEGVANHYLMDTAEHRAKYASKIRKVYEDIYKALKDSMKDALEDEEKRLKQIVDDIKEEKKVRVDALKAQQEAELKEIKSHIDALKEEQKAVKKGYDERIEALKRESSEYDAQTKLMKLKEELAKAKTTYQYVMNEQGRFVWMANEEAVDQAREAVYEEEMQQAYDRELQALEDARDKADEIYDQRIDDLEKYYDDVKERQEQALDELEAHYDKLAEERQKDYDNFKEYADKLLDGEVQHTDALDTEWGRRVNKLADFTDKYKGVLQQLVDAQVAADNAIIESASRPIPEHTGGGGGGGSSSSSASAATDTGVSPIEAARKRKDEILGVTRDANGNPIYKKSSTEAARKRKDEALGVTRDANGKPTYKKKASGDSSLSSDGIYLVGDSPNTELVIGSKLNGVPLTMSKGTGVVNAKSTRTLAGILNTVGAKFGMGQYGFNYSSGQNSTSIHIGTINLPEVKDGKDFVNYLQNFNVDMMTMAYTR